MVLHNGPLSRRQRWDAALINTGPRAILTGFTAAEYLGLTGWQRDWIDVLAAAGASPPVSAALIRIRLHRSRSQQRLASPDSLLAVVNTARCTRHQRALRAALYDIAGGSQALSEIDFARLCHRYGLPTPIRQAIRTDADGRRRFLDASWRRADGRLVVVEVDGALHVGVSSWWADQERQNWLTLGDALILRFPSWAIRHDEQTVVRQLRAALRP